MFVQISPSDQDLSETLSSLNFATRVRGVELGPVRKQVDTGELQKLKTMVCLVFSFYSMHYNNSLLQAFSTTWNSLNILFILVVA